MRQILWRSLDDLLLLAGCGCVVYGLSLWSAVVMWIVAGVMLIGFGVMVAKERAKNVTAD